MNIYQYIGTLALVVFTSFSAYSRMDEEKFQSKVINRFNDFEKVLDLIGSNEFSPEQKLVVANKIKSISKSMMGIKLRASIKEEASKENKVALANTTNTTIPSHVELMFKSSNGFRQVYSPARQPRLDVKKKAKPVVSPLSTDDTDMPSDDEDKENSVDEETKNNFIYFKRAYGDDYYGNYIPHNKRINVTAMMKQKQKEFPHASYQEIMFHVALEGVALTRTSMQKYPTLFNSVYYVGLTTEGRKRMMNGHRQDNLNELTSAHCTKAKGEKEILQHCNVSVHPLFENVPEDDLPFYERVGAEEFQVQTTGFSASIANLDATRLYKEFTQWPLFIQRMKDMGVENLIKDQTASSVKGLLKIR